MAIKDYRFENLPRSKQMMVFAALIVGLSFTFYWYFLKGLIKEHRRLQADITKLEAKVAEATAIESRLNLFKQELAQLEQRLAVLQSILPAQKETPALLRSVQQMASSSNLKINRFSPQPIVPRTFYSDWPIQMEVEGNYNGLGLFFEKISRAPRIIDVGNITIKGIEDSEDATKTLSASCTATTYVFKEEPPLEPKKADSRKSKESKKSKNKKEKKR